MTARRIVPLTVCALLAAVGACHPPKPGDPLKGLSATERAQFDKGKVVFDSVFIPERGLGPLFNSTACGECHEDPVAGGTGDEIERHATVFHPLPVAGTRMCDELAGKGGPVYQLKVTPLLHVALNIDTEPVPPEATGRGLRTTPVILGFGLLDAVPDSAILAYADPDDRDHDGISGRPNRFFDGRVGRFGRKALVPTLREFNIGALTAEEGVTSPTAPDEETVAGLPLPAETDPAPDPELPESSVTALNDFVRLLAPPAPQRLTREAKTGRDLFTQIGCAKCHVPSLPVRNGPIAALQHGQVDAYSDLLLHDMGLDLADICLGLATPSEFRTEPLMGLRLRKRFLHDGRAGTLTQAITQHGGEATEVRDRFLRLLPAEKSALLAFLQRL
jgi:CxxC motif-containing protein (DUF1111 family)